MALKTKKKEALRKKLEELVPPHHPLFALCFPNVVVTREYLKERRDLVPAVYKKMLKKDDDLRKRHHKKEVTHMHKAQAALVRESYKN